MKKTFIILILVYLFNFVTGQNLIKDQDLCNCFKKAIRTKEFKELISSSEIKDSIKIIGNFNIEICNIFNIFNKIYLYDSIFPQYINRQVERNNEEIRNKAKGILILEYKNKKETIKFMFWEPSTNALLIMEITKKRKKVNIVFDGVM